MALFLFLFEPLLFFPSRSCFVRVLPLLLLNAVLFFYYVIAVVGAGVSVGVGSGVGS
jgi:hypothetical protein